VKFTNTNPKRERGGEDVAFQRNIAPNAALTHVRWRF